MIEQINEQTSMFYNVLDNKHYVKHCWLFRYGGKKMPIEKEDLRVVKTRAAIKHAFIELIEQKGFDAVTVKDITTLAQINRGTFYAHYEDKYHLMNSIEQEFFNDMFSIGKSHFPLIQQAITSATPQFIAIEIFNYLYKQRASLKVFLSSKGDQQFIVKLKEFMWQQIFVKNLDVFFKSENMHVPSEYFVSYIASAHLGVIQKWIEDDCIESPQEMARILSTMTMRGPLYAAGLKVQDE